jgi:hypothetical protein
MRFSKLYAHATDYGRRLDKQNGHGLSINQGHLMKYMYSFRLFKE